MPKKLTHRQQQFLSQFLDIYQEMKQSVHYGVVAERLGIGKVTAYEMLRLLEEHGLVRAEYQPNPEQHGPGRAPVLFYPTRQGDQLINGLAGPAANQDDWAQVKEQILQNLRDGKSGDYDELLSKLLAHMPESHSPLVFAAELITSMLLTLASIQDIPEIKAIMKQLRRIGLPQEIGLSVMSGIGMILSVFEQTRRRSTTILLTQVKRYEEVLSQLSEDSQRQLSEFTREVIRLISR
jgi:hypothetical protein